MYTTEGKHYLIDLYGCENTNFEMTDVLKMVVEAGCKPLSYVEHNFDPQGKSGVYLLEESHISVHTYPEHNYVSIDVYTCGTKADPTKALKYAETLFKPNYTDLLILKRGVKKWQKTAVDKAKKEG